MFLWPLSPHAVCPMSLLRAGATWSIPSCVHPLVSNWMPAFHKACDTPGLFLVPACVAGEQRCWKEVTVLCSPLSLPEIPFPTLQPQEYPQGFTLNPPLGDGLRQVTQGVPDTATRKCFVTSIGCPTLLLVTAAPSRSIGTDCALKSNQGEFSPQTQQSPHPLESLH